MDEIRVLIVDDDATLGATLTLGLDALGMQPSYQTSLAGLQSVVQSINPNIIILDVEIGEDNGIDQMQQLKLYAPNIPVIFMSSHADVGYLTRAMGEGAVNYLKKPFEIDRLFLEYPHETIPRKTLKHKLWPDGNDSDASLDNYISQLRKIFTADKSIHIITIPKIGFKLEIS